MTAKDSLLIRTIMTLALLKNTKSCMWSLEAKSPGATCQWEKLKHISPPAFRWKELIRYNSEFRLHIDVNASKLTEVTHYRPVKKKKIKTTKKLATDSLFDLEYRVGNRVSSPVLFERGRIGYRAP